MSYHYWLLPQSTLLVPWSIYSLFGVVGFFLILVIVLLLYVHLCIQPPAEMGLSSVHLFYRSSATILEIPPSPDFPFPADSLLTST